MPTSSTLLRLARVLNARIGPRKPIPGETPHRLSLADSFIRRTPDSCRHNKYQVKPSE